MIINCIFKYYTKLLLLIYKLRQKRRKRNCTWLSFFTSMAQLGFIVGDGILYQSVHVVTIVGRVHAWHDVLTCAYSELRSTNFVARGAWPIGNLGPCSSFSPIVILTRVCHIRKIFQINLSRLFQCLTVPF